MALASLAAALCAATLLAGPCGAADSASARAQGAARTATHAAEGRVAVVYHLSEGIDQAARALGNIRNHLAADPTVHIVVVGLGGGIDFMLSGAHDAHGNPFDVTIEDLARQGVEFRACNNTLHARGIDPARLVPEAQVVPAGVAEIARLQAREGFAYIRP
ncbi:MAG: DsrE family protein [Pseudomonadota bacterium]|nr:DsrE family protein [Pseudomonadota bacterium]